jgi:predicted outer membrane protein
VRPPVPRFVRWAVALAVIAALTVVVFQYWGTSQYPVAIAARDRAAGQAGQPQATVQDENWMPTRWGPLGPADRDLLVMIRQAGLCGGSSGRQAQTQGSNPQVRTVAKKISADYGDLDNQLRAVAGKLGVALPNQPTAQQQGWMKQLSAQSGSKYDRTFAQRLRVTEGEVLPAITAVRAGTRNELIRSFAANAAVLVNRHMEALERTGLVDYTKLPAPPAPVANTTPAGPTQAVNQVANVTPVRATSGINTNAMIAALVSTAGVLLALGLLGTGKRIRRPAPAGAQHRIAPRGYATRPTQRRRAAHRW